MRVVDELIFEVVVLAGLKSKSGVLSIVTEGAMSANRRL